MLLQVAHTITTRTEKGKAIKPSDKIVVTQLLILYPSISNSTEQSVLRSQNSIRSSQEYPALHGNRRSLLCTSKRVKVSYPELYVSSPHSLKYSAATARFTTAPLHTISSLSHASIKQTLKHGKGFSDSYKMHCSLRNSKQYKLRHPNSHKCLHNFRTL
jgi:hypothetical protein